MVILTVLVFAGALFLFSVQYQTNDDVGMNLYAAGKALGQPPSEFLLFQHFVIGLMLKFLYTHFPLVPWYGAFLYAYLFLSCLTAAYAIARLRPSFRLACLSIAPLILFYLQVIISPQFTICAGYLAISGVLLLYSRIYKPSFSKRGNFCMVNAASAVLILAGLIRFYSLLLALVLMGPLYLYLSLVRDAKALRYFVVVLVGVVCLSGILNWWQHTYYQHSPGWEHFYSYNNVRADFMDRRRIMWDERTESLFKQVGWSRNDLAMLISWFYLDPKIYSFQNLRFISEHASVLPPPRIAWNQIFADLRKCFSLYGGLAVLFLCGWLLLNGSTAVRSFALFALLWCSVLFVGINIVERHLPLRVWLVMVFGLYLTEVALWCQVSQELVRSRSGRIRIFGGSLRSVLGPAFITACCCAQIGFVSYLGHLADVWQIRFRRDLARLQPRPDQLFVTWGGNFPYEEFQLPNQAQPVSQTMQLLGLGVGNHEPFVQNRLRSFNIDDLYQSFYTRDDIFLICKDSDKNLLIRYIQEHYQTKVQIATVFKGMTFSVSKVKKEISMNL